MKLMDIKDVADFCRFSRSHIYKLIHDEAFLEGYQDGRYRRWLEEEVNTFAILFWGLNKPLPDIDDEKLLKIRSLAEKAKMIANKNDNTN